jgi:hypothetical protein
MIPSHFAPRTLQVHRTLNENEMLDETIASNFPSGPTFFMT